MLLCFYRTDEIGNERRERLIQRCFIWQTKAEPSLRKQLTFETGRFFLAIVSYIFFILFTRGLCPLSGKMEESKDSNVMYPFIPQQVIKSWHKEFFQSMIMTRWHSTFFQHQTDKRKPLTRGAKCFTNRRQDDVLKGYNAQVTSSVFIFVHISVYLVRILRYKKAVW